MLSVHPRTITRRIEDGSLRAYKFGNKTLRIREEHLLELLEPVKTVEGEAERILEDVRKRQ